MAVYSLPMYISLLFSIDYSHNSFETWHILEELSHDVSNTHMVSGTRILCFLNPFSIFPHDHRRSCCTSLRLQSSSVSWSSLKSYLFPSVLQPTNGPTASDTITSRVAGCVPSLISTDPFLPFSFYLMASSSLGSLSFLSTRNLVGQSRTLWKCFNK